MINVVRAVGKLQDAESIMPLNKGIYFFSLQIGV